MEELLPFLFFCQAFGAAVGAVSAVWGELAYLRAIRDGHIDRAERIHLDVLARGLRYGLTLILLSSLGVTVASYTLERTLQPAQTGIYWIFITLSVLVIILSWALSRGRVGFSMGSASLFTAWWFLFYLSFGLFPALSFGAAVGLYVVSAALFYGILSCVRVFNLHKR